MSHYTVLVITEDGDYKKALAPFDESLEVEPYISKTREQILEKYKKDVEKNNGAADPDSYFMCAWGSETLTEEEVVSKYQKWSNCDLDEEGNVISTYNLNSKWDWYSLGGRWLGSLKLKEGVKSEVASEPSLMAMLSGGRLVEEDNMTDFAQAKDVDLSYSEEDPARVARFWEINVEDSPKTEEEKDDPYFEGFYKKEYYLEQYGDKETYVDEKTSFRTYAVLYKGEWIEPGQMGWFACSDATPDSYAQYRKAFKKIISELKPEDYLAVVDCHI